MHPPSSSQTVRMPWSDAPAITVVLVALVVVPLAFVPLVFGLWPDVQDLHVGPLPLWWAILGFAVYPAILGVGWWYVKASTRNEQQFADLVEER